MAEHQQPESEGEIKTVKRICSWCGKEMGEYTTRVRPGLEPVSHGICDDCRKEYFGEGPPPEVP